MTGERTAEIEHEVERQAKPILTLGDLIGKDVRGIQRAREAEYKPSMTIDEIAKTIGDYKTKIGQYNEQAKLKLDKIGAKIEGIGKYSRLESVVKFFGLLERANKMYAKRIGNMGLGDSMQLVMDYTRAYYQVIQKICVQLEDSKNTTNKTLEETANGLLEATKYLRDKNPEYLKRDQDLKALKDQLVAEADDYTKAEIQKKIDVLNVEHHKQLIELAKQVQYKKSAVQNHEYATALSELLVNNIMAFSLEEAKVASVIKYGAKNMRVLATVLTAQQAYFEGKTIPDMLLDVLDTGLVLAGKNTVAATDESIADLQRDLYDREAIHRVLEETQANRARAEETLAKIINQITQQGAS